MPPSGYIAKEALNIEIFLRSNATRLRIEAEGDGSSLIKKINKEKIDILFALKNQENSTIQRGTLYLSLSLYELLLGMGEVVETCYDQSVEEAISLLGKDIVDFTIQY